MTDLTIKPTHTCFDDAGAIFVNMLRESPLKVNRLRVVHAICLMPETHKAYTHAWVEDGNEVLFNGVYQDKVVTVVVDKQEFYAEMRVQDFTAYDAQELIVLDKRYGNTGPWKQKYLELCKDYHPSKALQS